MHEYLRAVRDLVWPASCAACGLSGATVCPACAVEAVAAPILRVYAPTPCPPGFPETVVWGQYTGALSRLVVAYKDAERTDISAIFAALLEDVVERAMAGTEVGLTPCLDPVLVPMPSSARARRQRGREPVLDLCRRIRPRARVRLLSGLRVVRKVGDQSGLGSAERKANLAGSMALRPGAAEALSGADVILVDDVVTTGATLQEATRAVLAGFDRDPDGPPLARLAPPASLRAVTICATFRRRRGRSLPRGAGVH
ncbi:MAG: ComF family protein [Actinomycetia bacterium]|nr:ComF family protein [Actinomycetes bacterium]